MSLARTLEVLRLDLRFHARRPLMWVLALLVALLAWGLSSGHVGIQSGDSEVGGHKAWITSQFAQAQLHSILVLLVHSFFIAVAFGMAIIRDDEQKVGELLHSTPLTVAEYVWGKFGALCVAFAGLFALQIAATIFFNHALKTAESAEFVGPFSLASYVVPVIEFALPAVLFLAGTSFLVGAWTKRPVLVFLLPTALLLACVFLVWDFSPSWLAPAWDHFLQWIDPAGFRWLSETWIKVDKGVDYYNTQPIGLDAGFVLSRLGFVALGLVSVLATQAHLARSIRATRKVSAIAVRESEAREIAPRVERTPFAPEPARAPSLVAGIVEVARAELRELKSQPGLYIFVPLILLQVVGNLTINTGAFDTPLLVTPGIAAAGSMNTLTLCLCLLLLFYTTESLERERARGLAAIYYATPVRSASILFGKLAANTFVGAVVILAAFVGSAGVILFQGKVRLDLVPFVACWGLLLVPTLVVWSAFVTMLYAIARNRYGTYAAALGALILTGWLQVRGHVNWASNWDLWGAVRWSDLGFFELTRTELFLNRAAWLALAVLFIAIAVRFFPRRALDAASVVERLRPASMLATTLRLAPFWVAPMVLLTIVAVRAREGFQGPAARKAAKDYWMKNVQTWKDAEKPAITDLVLDLELDPPTRHLRSKGTYTLVNDRKDAIARFAVTAGPRWKDPKWTLAGADATPEDRAGLFVFTPATPLRPGETTTLGFEFETTFPDGATENGGNVSEFVLPSGAVLTSFSASFAPMMGWVDEIGVDEDNRSDPKQWPDDFYEGVTDSAFGNNTPCTTRITITAPEEYTLNSVGELVSDTVEAGKRTSVWKSDHPVDFANVVAGKWAVKRGTGTALYYHPGHAYNVDEMSRALDGARKWYSQWFATYPWKELKLSEFAGHAGYAQGFPTNITFSENIGFLTRSEPDAQVAFMVTAHESAHQWWGNILNPGKGPGGNVLSEGMAHFSTGLLMEAMQGERERIAFFEQIEEKYGKDRQVDSEKPLVKLTGDRPGDTTCTYDKGGWVAWMLLDLMGRERMLAGCRDFIARYEKGPDHPVIQDFLAVMREHAEDVAAFDAFAKQWYEDVVVPRYAIDAASATQVATARDDGGAGEEWDVTFTIANRGTGTMPVEVAAELGERWPEHATARERVAPDARAEPATAAVLAAGEPVPVDASKTKGAVVADPFRSARTRTTLGAGESRELTLRCAFRPKRLVVDPDAKVLMLERKKARRDV